MKVFTKEDLLMLGDGDEGLVEYEYDEAFVKSLGSFLTLIASPSKLLQHL